MHIIATRNTLPSPVQGCWTNSLDTEGEDIVFLRLFPSSELLSVRAEQGFMYTAVADRGGAQGLRTHAQLLRKENHVR